MIDYTELKLKAQHATGHTDMSLAPEVVLSVIVENERLQSVEHAFAEWVDKTEWVQKTCHWSELGKHRADVLRERIEQLQTGFKNFHRSLCERFGYFHDDFDWQRDQVSLEEHIATQFSHVNAENAALRGQVQALQRGAGQQQEQIETLLEGMTRIMQSTRLGDPAFGIACEVVGELDCSTAKAVQP